MSISNITSSTSTYATSNQSVDLTALLEKLKATASSSSSSSSDTVTISAESLAALLQSADGAKPPPMNDEQAAKMGADIKEQNAELFTQLDTDEDGVLSASEAEDGKDAIHEAIQNGSLKPPAPPQDQTGAPAGSAETSTEDLTSQRITSLHNRGLSNDEIATTLGTTTQKVADVLQG
jgi:hypothetical protein